MSIQDVALEELLALIEDYHDYNPAQVTQITVHPTAVAFSLQVSKGLPCVYSDLPELSSCDASKWTKQHLIDAVEAEVEVASTPDGRADSLYARDGSEKVFIQPANIDIKLATLFDKLDAAENKHRPVYYLQSQNSNLTNTSLQPLLQDLPSNFNFAKDVIGEPEAINIWIGDERSVTSVHRDPYENLYVVLRGSKIFTLWPPVDEICMDAQMVRTGRHCWHEDTATFSIEMDDLEGTDEASKIPWVPIDPHLPREQLNNTHPLYKYARPQTVEIHAGQTLYLPSGWYHHVAQKCGTWDDGTRSPCIAINYWYDMDYEGEKYVMRQLINRLTKRVLRQI